MADEINLNAYFERIGFAGSIAPTVETLEVLHALHPASIPFENLNPLLGLPVLLDPRSLEEKLLRERRGGYCFEHNLTLMRALRSLGYTVKGHAARVLWGRPEGAITPRGHMLLSVEIAGATYIADVGFGGFTLTAPLKLRPGIEQETPHEIFRITGGDPAYRVEVKLGEEWRVLYQFDMTEQFEVDYEAANFYLSTSPDSRFRSALIACIAPKGRRLVLNGTRLTTYVRDREPERQELASPEALRGALAAEFGIGLPPTDLLMPALERVVAASSPAVAV